jgi:Zn-dependent protease
MAGEASISLDVARCAACGTELAPHALACPACTALVHADGLKQIASSADERERAGDRAAAIDIWRRALRLLPPDSQQHATIRQHIASLTDAAQTDSSARTNAERAAMPAWKRALAGTGGVLLLALGKLKFLLLGLTKLGTLLSMVAFFGVYWNYYGWPLAAGLVLSIYIHEMGHVMELRRFGIAAGAPIFIPGLGALVRLKQHVDDAVTDARIGLAGPIWGTIAGLAAFGVYLATHTATWAAIAQLTGWINLFNLIPIWQLDGSRGFHALDRAGRVGMAVFAVALFGITAQKWLLAIALVAGYRAFFTRAVVARSDRRTMVTFAVLLATLAGLAAIRPF